MVIDVIRVFCDDTGAHGNPLGVVRQSAELTHEQAQQVAATLGYSETIFLDDEDAGSLRIHTPTTRLAFAGHPTVGAAWYLHRIGSSTSTLRLDVGAVQVEAHLAGACVMAPIGVGPDWNLVQLDSADLVDLADTQHHDTSRMDYVWAWQDEASGLVRARSFASAVGVAEDEATGSAAVALAARLGRPITIRQGAGSILLAEPMGPDHVRLSGQVVDDQALTDDARRRIG